MLQLKLCYKTDSKSIFPLRNVRERERFINIATVKKNNQAVIQANRSMISNISAFHLPSSLTLCFEFRAHLRPLIETNGSFPYPVAHPSSSVNISTSFVGDGTQRARIQHLEFNMSVLFFVCMRVYIFMLNFQRISLLVIF